jgi:leucyl-tRNA synthetase
VHAQAWPVADPVLVKVDSVTMVVQVNGKVRERVDVDAGISEDEAAEVALALPKVVAALAGRSPVKVIARPPRLVNVVV